MKLKIYLDDVRTPVDKDAWMVVRNYDEFVDRITKIGLKNIEIISLDHDLGETAMAECHKNVYHNYTFNNDNIIVTVGSDIDINLGSSASVQSSNTQWLPNLNIEFVLSKDRKLRLIIFNKYTLDVSFGRRNRQGISISYRRDFDKLIADKPREIQLPPPAESDK
jgi:hypothetical protein